MYCRCDFKILSTDYKNVISFTVIDLFLKKCKLYFFTFCL